MRTTHRIMPGNVPRETQRFVDGRCEIFRFLGRFDRVSADAVCGANDRAAANPSTGQEDGLARSPMVAAWERGSGKSGNPGCAELAAHHDQRSLRSPRASDRRSTLTARSIGGRGVQVRKRCVSHVSLLPKFTGPSSRPLRRVAAPWQRPAEAFRPNVEPLGVGFGGRRPNRPFRAEMAACRCCQLDHRRIRQRTWFEGHHAEPLIQHPREVEPLRKRQVRRLQNQALSSVVLAVKRYSDRRRNAQGVREISRTGSRCLPMIRWPGITRPVLCTSFPAADSRRRYSAMNELIGDVRCWANRSLGLVGIKSWATRSSRQHYVVPA